MQVNLGFSCRFVYMRKHLSTSLIAVAVLLVSAQVQAQVISTIAGTFDNVGYTGDGGPASAAILNSPSDLVLDSIGNLYFTDFVNNVIRKIDTSGTITTVAGNGFGAGGTASGGYSGDGGQATAAELNGPFGLAIDRGGNIIFADGYNHVVRKVSTSGIITTIAGKNTTGYTGDGGAATAATLNNPVGIAIDKKGNIYIADDHNNAIRKVDTAGKIYTFAGNNTGGYSGDGGQATTAAIKDPIGVCTDTAGNVYFAEADNGVIRMVNTLGIISTFAGRTDTGYSGDGGAATAARLRSPERVNTDDSGNVYISDFFNNVVRKVNPAGIITTFAGDGTGAGTGGSTGAYGGDGGPATAAQLTLPSGVAVGHTGLVYICDRGNQVIRRIGPAVPVDTVNHTGVYALNSSGTTLNVYPNPARNGAFSVDIICGTNEAAEVCIVNVLGATVKKFTTATNRLVSLKLDVPAGMYFISASTAQGKLTKEITIE